VKNLYLIKHAKSDWSTPEISDVERELTKKGLKDIVTIGSYLLLRGNVPDVMLSSCALRAAKTSDLLATKMAFDGPKHYLEELYLTSAEIIKELIMVQESHVQNIFVIGHNPQLTELANLLSSEHISKLPSMGVVAINFEIDEWSQLEQSKGEIDFFVYPKQFKYYMPRQIRTTLSR
jgi:phosphohistidine phosphatase